MSKVKPGLGRGLNALIRSSENYSEESPEREAGRNQQDRVQELQVDRIERNPYQPRTVFQQDALNELKQSILSNGLLQPITVRPMDDDTYQLISGERRLRAYREIGYKTIPALIKHVTSEETMLALALIENIQRERLNSIEVGLAYKRLMEECSLTQEQIAEKVGKDRTTVANSIRLLKLPEQVKTELVNENISMGHARTLINVPTKELQLDILDKILKQNLSVRKTEQLVKKALTGELGGKKTGSGNKKTQQSGNPSINAVQDSLRRALGTKVLCKQKSDGSGDITIEFYSNDELDRLLDLFNIIEKNNY